MAGLSSGSTDARGVGSISAAVTREISARAFTDVRLT